jgi:hypothetical protein
LRKQTRSILDELSGMVPSRDKSLVIESRANHIINSAINLLQIIKENYPQEQAEELERRLLNSIRGSDPAKFSRGLKKISNYTQIK